MRKNTGCLIIFLIVCFIGGYLSRITNEDKIRLSTKKVLTVYPNKKTISLFTDFNNIEKGSYSNPIKIKLNEFNEIESKKIKIDKRELLGGNREVQLVNDKIKNNKIYVLNDFGYGEIKAIIFDNRNNIKTYSKIDGTKEFIKNDLNYVWDFDREYQNFIHNKTDKYLYLEPRIYGYGVFTDKKIETIEIAPNQIISSSLPDYFFENEPPYSIKIPKGLSEVIQYWLHY